jgi:hypothetical protein
MRSRRRVEYRCIASRFCAVRLYHARMALLIHYLRMPPGHFSGATSPEKQKSRPMNGRDFDAWV